MWIKFLGTSAGCPTLKRNVTSIALIINNPNYEIWLFDCGEATQHQILKSYIKITKIRKIFITHLHADHVLGLIGLLTTISINKSNNKLEIYGCKGIKKYINYSLKFTNSYISYPIKIHEIKQGEIFNNGILKVKCFSLCHNIECYGYYIKELDKKGSLNVDKLIFDGIMPGPIYKRIKNNNNIMLNGKKINCNKYINGIIKGKKIFIFGDTSPIKVYNRNLFKSDLLIHEATLHHKYYDIANLRGHSTNIQAAYIAKKYCVKKLIITHLSARYNYKDLKNILLNCIKIFPNTFIAYDFYTVKV